MSQAALSPSPLLDVPLPFTKGLDLGNTVLSDLNLSSWFSALPTTPQPTNKGHFPTPV